MRKNYKNLNEETVNGTYVLKKKILLKRAYAHTDKLCLVSWSFSLFENGWGWGLLSCEWLWPKVELSAAAQTQSLGCLYRFISPSLGFLLRVPQLLQPLGVALSHGVHDGNDKVADHDQHHLLKHPRQPVLILKSPRLGWTCFIFFNLIQANSEYQSIQSLTDKTSRLQLKDVPIIKRLLCTACPPEGTDTFYTVIN